MKKIAFLICITFILASYPLISMGAVYDPNDLATVNQIKSQGGTCVAVWNDMLPQRLESLMVSGNMTGYLTIIDCIYLKYLSFTGVQMQALTVTGCNSLETVGCSSSQVVLIQLNNNRRLKGIVCNQNPQLLVLDVSNSPRLQGLNASNTKIKTLKIEGDTVLMAINCESNLATKLTVTGATKATALDLKNSTNLNSFVCTGTTLSKLNLNGCTALESLNCSENSLEKLDVSNCTKLKTVDCSKNQIDSLDLSNCMSLTSISCTCNHLSDINLPTFYGLNFGCDDTSYKLDLRYNHEFTENNIKTLDANLACLSYEQIIWNDFIPCSTELEWEKKPKDGPEHPKGVVCDSVSSIIVKLSTAVAFNTDEITIKLSDLNGDISEPLGRIGTTKENASSPELTIKNPDKNEYLFHYVAPDVFTNKTDSKDWIRKILVEIKLDCNRTYKDTINLIRPPVLLVHGFNEGTDIFTNYEGIQTYLTNLGRYSTKSKQIFCVDYSTINRLSFVDIDNKGILHNNIKYVKTELEFAGYSTSKVDLIGHSMGGNVIRMYLQGKNYDNELHKLITLNTPHSGTQGANMLYPIIASGKKIGDYFSNDIFDGGAWSSLQFDNYAIKVLLNGNSNLNRSICPSHAIVSHTETFLPLLKNPLVAQIYIGCLLKNPGETIGTTIDATITLKVILHLLYGENSDVIVPVSSQRGGLADSAITIIDNEWHNGTLTNPTVKSKVAELLELPTNSTSFSKTGFHPPVLKWGFESKSNTVKKTPKLKTISSDKDSVRFILPTKILSAHNGDSFQVEVVRTISIKNLIFVAMESKDSVFLKDTTANTLKFTYKTPQYTIGKLPMYVFGADTLGNIYVDSVIVNVQPLATPKSLIVTYPADSLMLSQGFKSSVHLGCLFSDGIMRDITSLPEVQYTLQTGNAKYVSQGVLKGIAQGIDTLTVTYAGLSKKLPIIVERNFTCSVTATSQPVNAGTIKGTGEYCYGDSISLTAIPESGYTFYYWSEDSVEVSKDANYSFLLNDNRNLVANFQLNNITESEKVSELNQILYPNPATDILYINGLHVTALVTIYDISGKVVLTLQQVKDAIPISSLAKGIYMLKIMTDEGISMGRFVKK